MRIDGEIINGYIAGFARRFPSHIYPWHPRYNDVISGFNESALPCRSPALKPSALNDGFHGCAQSLQAKSDVCCVKIAYFWFLVCWFIIIQSIWNYEAWKLPKQQLKKHFLHHSLCIVSTNWFVLSAIILCHLFKDVQPRGFGSQNFWLLTVSSRVRFQVLQWDFSLAGEDPHRDHGLGNL